MYIPNKYSIETPDSIKFNTNPVTYRINNNQETKGNETEVFNNYFNNMSTHVYSSMTYSKVVYLYNYLVAISICCYVFWLCDYCIDMLYGVFVIKLFNYFIIILK